MSSIYSTEPPTKGKVILHTTSGDIDVELWPKEAPKAVRNFVQLCLEGYYDGCPFHRIIPDLMIQTGDATTGTGEGGESVFGEPFGDELHSRLRFTRRGLFACAGSGSSTRVEGKGASSAAGGKNNTSQFFVTLGAAPHLDRKHTIFGRVAPGDTIYTVSSIGETEVDEHDRPASDPKPRIVSAEVLWNPFDDIVPRSTAADRAASRAREEGEKRREVGSAAKTGLVAVRDRKLLSFGDGDGEEDDEDDDDDEEDGRDDEGGEQDDGARVDVGVEGDERREAKRKKRSLAGGMLSAHEASLGDSRLVLEAPGQGEGVVVRAGEGPRRGEQGEAAKAADEPATTAAAKRAAPEDVEEGGREEREPSPPAEEARSKPASTVSSRRAAALSSGKRAVRPATTATSKEGAGDAALLTEWQRKHARYAARKRSSGGKRDEATLRALESFTARLRRSDGAGVGGGGGGARGATATAAKAGAAVAAAAFIDQGDVSLLEVAGHQMVVARGEEEDG